MVEVALTVYCSKSITAQGWFCNYSLHEKVRFKFKKKKKKLTPSGQCLNLHPCKWVVSLFPLFNFFELLLFTESFHGPAN